MRTTVSENVESSDDAQGSEPQADERAVDQALAQEQRLFERNVFEARELFRLQLAMGWTTFVIVLASAAAIIIYPPTALGAVPISGMSIWNWRRMLERDTGKVRVITKRPGEEE